MASPFRHHLYSSMALRRISVRYCFERCSKRSEMMDSRAFRFPGVFSTLDFFCADRVHLDAELGDLRRGQLSDFDFLQQFAQLGRKIG